MRRSHFAFAATGVGLLAVAGFLMSSQPLPPAAAGFHIVGWNNLGMHCMDADYAVFSLLPPFNTIDAQVIDGNGKLVTSDANVKVTYEAVPDASGSINRSSEYKTNFWAFADSLYGGSTVPDTGLAGKNMPGPSNTPQAMSFDPAKRVFSAEGIPITPYDDLGRKRTYPMMKLVARTSTGTPLAETNIVLPVSDEMDCSLCHASTSNTLARPFRGWVADKNAERDVRLNILRKHDEILPYSSLYRGSLVRAGYNQHGLETTVVEDGKPILCAKCHASNALPGTGLPGIRPLTASMHLWHDHVTDPITSKRLGDSTNRASCYRCHPGSDTRCLRGTMGNSVASDGSLAMQCQSCHGQLVDVGKETRNGWFDEPTCQSCHTGTALQNNGQIRYTSVFDSVTGLPRVAVNATFATTPNTPVPGTSLYRFSAGHGNLRCESCHGSTHAEFPTSHGNDNVQSVALQGHAGTLVECLACHATMPDTVTGGPHGMHPVGQAWATGHGDAAENGNHVQCRVCHGTDYRGTELSLAMADRSFTTKFGVKSYPLGAKISCYGCHISPTSENPNPNRAPIAQPATGSTTANPIPFTLVASDPDNNPLTYRIVRQPAHGRVGLVGTVATYYPEPGFAGTDTFVFAAYDGSLDSNHAKITVTRGAEWQNYGTGYPGKAAKIPGLTASAAPVLGTQIQLLLTNTQGTDTAALLVFGEERASFWTELGGRILTIPIVNFGASVPAAGLTLPIDIPNDASIVGLQIHGQAAEIDAGARFQVAFSAGLTLTLGR